MTPSQHKNGPGLLIFISDGIIKCNVVNSNWKMGLALLIVQAEIERKIRDSLSPEYMDVVNESHMHNVPPGSESHFKAVVVSPVFNDLGLVQRHQHINALLADELAGPVHALSMETLTAPEWAAKGGQSMQSPACRGGSQADR